MRSSGFGRALVCVLLLAGAVSCGPADDRGGVGGSSPPRKVPWFDETSEESGLDFEHRSGHEERHLIPEAVTGGGALCDIDGDGDLDLYLIQGGSLADPGGGGPGNQLYENIGGFELRNVTADSGAADTGYGMGAACGDYDNDGDVDIYVTNYGGNVMLQNDGAGHFVDVTAEVGVGHPGWGSSAGFVDYDRDGDLDLFVVNYIHWSATTELDCFNQMGGPDYCSPVNYSAPAMDILYRNNGDGSFGNVTAEAGLAAAFGNGLGFAFGDFNEDGWLDIFVANDGVVDQLWINLGDGTFEDRALIAGCAVDLEGGVPKAGMGVTTADVDNDGDLDLLVCNLVDESDSYYRNDGEFFTDVTSRSGLGTTSRHFTRFGMGWVDFDNDGWLDLYQANGRVRRASEAHSEDRFAEPNLLFRGGADGRFEEVLPRGGTPDLLVATSRAAAFGDLDNDGGIDVVVVNRDASVHLLRNAVPQRGHWLTLRVLEEHGRDAEGAVLFVDLPDRRLRRDVRAGYSFASSNDPRVHFGLGGETRIESVTVRWVDGASESFGPFEADRVATIRRGTGTP